MKTKLTNKELKEPIDITLGRLRGIMITHNDPRGLAFVEKVIKYIDKIKPVRN
jgi:hypothetical protein